MSNSAHLNKFLGFGIRGYRSFISENIALVGPFEKVHLITGQNNSGKSALADIAYRILPRILENGTINGQDYPLTAKDFPQGNQQSNDDVVTLSLCFSYDSLFSNISGKKQIAKKEIEAALSNGLVTRGEKSACWFDFDIPIQSHTSSKKELVLCEEFAEKLADECNTVFHEAAIALAHSADANPQRNLDSIVKKLIPWDSIPQVIKVEAIRHVTDDNKPNTFEVSGGEGLVGKLRRLKMPSVEEQFENQRKWDRFERFIRDILNDPEAEVTTDAEAKVIQVKSGTPGFLELSDLGTGIEELVIMAAVTACNDNKLIFIEEPEIHLHPTLQSKLIQYFLDDKNGNRFLITTHSPSIINCSNVTITQVAKIQGTSTASQVRGIADARDVLNDLGAKPSDLLQSNYVIWVEGPSDRIYMNYWINVIEPRLNEGTHYSVIMYGGKLLNACSADTPGKNNNLINLFKVNTHFCVLMDSDRSKKGAQINSTKLRIRKECESSGNMSWVTDGRTIENYVPAATLRHALKALYPSIKYDWEMDEQYICPLGGKFEGKNYGPDKVKVARKVVELGYDLPIDLRKRIEKLVEKIKEVNNL